MALEGHSCGDNISKNCRNLIDVNHFTSTNVKKSTHRKIGFSDPPRALQNFEKITKSVWGLLFTSKTFNVEGRRRKKIFSTHPNIHIQKHIKQFKEDNLEEDLEKYFVDTTLKLIDEMFTQTELATSTLKGKTSKFNTKMGITKGRLDTTRVQDLKSIIFKIKEKKSVRVQISCYIFFLF